VTASAFAEIRSCPLHRKAAKDRHILVANDMTDRDTCNVTGGGTNVV
jgi:hypothetical protein